MIYNCLTPQAGAHFLKENKDNPDCILLDVRTLAEFQTGYLEGAQNLDIYAADFRTKLILLEQEKTYVIYCRSGYRSRTVAEMMIGLGFTKVYDLGGILEWMKYGLSVVQPAK